MSKSRRKTSSQQQAPAQHSEPVSQVSNDQMAGSMADAGLEGASGSLPYLDALEASFGGRALDGVPVSTGAAADDATSGMGATAYAKGGAVALGQGTDLHTTAHEAAHLFQQTSGTSRAGDGNENQANAIADRVVAGESAADLMTGLSMQPTESPGLSLDTGTPDVSAATDSVEGAQSDLDAASQDADAAVSTGKEVVDTAVEVWKIAVPYLKGEKEFRGDKSVYEEKGPVKLSADVVDHKDFPDLVANPLIDVHFFRKYGLKNIVAKDIRVVSTDPNNADMQATLSAEVGIEGGISAMAGVSETFGRNDKYEVFAGVGGSASLSGHAGEASLNIHKTQTNGSWSGEGFKMDLNALSAELKGSVEAGAFLKWTSWRGIDREIGKKYTWPEDASIWKGQLEGISIDNRGDSFQILIGQDTLSDRVKALGDQIHTFFEERPGRLRGQAEEEESSESDGAGEAQEVPQSEGVEPAS
jgi:hypothetical protein